ncbi:hypothetical protein JF544_02785 [Halobacillus kuroshimensis]|uniref:Uncharacterized protein n=1 Tax=Halobacillus kuroshimensis TaxID=302481 RepID=A0ABS3DS58_9BACI|nr:hypothetical protein [Halobacillus kuroshimensis]MBN8234151.1 hypothetical protein [Halobacillus kuroshimensis]
MRLFSIFILGCMLLFAAVLSPHGKFQELAYSWSDDLNIASSVELSDSEAVFFQPLSFPLLPDLDDLGSSMFIHASLFSFVQFRGLFEHQVLGVQGENRGFLIARHANSTYT